MMYRYLIMLKILVLIGVTAQAQEVKVDKPFPRGLDKGLVFNMLLEGFLDRFTDAEFIEENSFRKVYKMIPYLKDIKEVYLYFDKDGEEPLYEMIFVFHETEKAKETALKLYGSPNYNDTEWRMKYKYLTLWSWIYKNKMVLVGNSYNSNHEWTDSFN
ncbi:hypothetical protein [Aquimarina brevivitae]|uniref:Uncharacterized protein n=1 Tax=Aquimarina brevivitae TaxID=323412 RepID=A0A4Q7PJB7_9FLAO|nr:hypothetical protein [Aquimarina brevivitae]RZT00139.1 hypothetical protein EV197_1372 [Aquimarina brevivitae]